MAERKKLDRHRSGKTTSFRVDDSEGYITCGEYENGELGEIFIKIAKQGSFVAGVLDALAIMTSIALQYGVPLELIVDKMRGMRFEPMGRTNDEELPQALSIIDYLYRRVGLDYLPDSSELKPLLKDVSESIVE